jgi:hypothetical protein
VFEWLSHIPLWLLGLLLFAAIVAAAWLGRVERQRRERTNPEFAKLRNETQEGYVVSGILALLGLLIGFTFSMVLDRFEGRRMLVVEDAAAIETLYLQVQLLEEPHRTRLSGLLTRYADNHVELAEVNGQTGDRLLRDNQRLLLELWNATIPAFNSIRGIDFSAAFAESVNHVIELDTQRKAARKAQIPAPIFALLFVYVIVAAMVVSFVMGEGARLATGTLLVLFTLALLLISDINRPVSGMIRESQEPMILVRDMIHANPPGRFTAPPAQPVPGV